MVTETSLKKEWMTIQLEFKDKTATVAKEHVRDRSNGDITQSHLTDLPIKVESHDSSTLLLQLKKFLAPCPHSIHHKTR